MGFGNRRAGFFGHGVGPCVDELPVIAPCFDGSLEEGMTIALEPKKGIPGTGIVGTGKTPSSSRNAAASPSPGQARG